VFGALNLIYQNKQKKLTQTPTIMKTKYILTAIAVSVASIVFAGNDPQVSVNNYKHPGKAAKAQAQIDAMDGKEITQVNKETADAGNYKSNFKKTTYTYVKTQANQGSCAADAKTQSHNYKNQFQFRNR